MTNWNLEEEKLTVKRRQNDNWKLYSKFLVVQSLTRFSENRSSNKKQWHRNANVSLWQPNSTFTKECWISTLHDLNGFNLVPPPPTPLCILFNLCETSCLFVFCRFAVQFHVTRNKHTILPENIGPSFFSLLLKHKSYKGPLLPTSRKKNVF